MYYKYYSMLYFKFPKRILDIIIKYIIDYYYIYKILNTSLDVHIGNYWM